MDRSIRYLLALMTLAIVLAACGSTGTSVPPSTDPSPTPIPSVAPSDSPAETPDAAPQVVGTLTIVGAAVDGPGEPLAAAMTRDLSEPVFIRGFVFKDTDGQVYFADAMTEGPRVLLSGYPTDGPPWDLGQASVTGLQEADGVLFYEDATVYGDLVLS